MAESADSVVKPALREPDRETRELLRLMAASEHPPMWDLTAPAARALYDPMTAASAHESEAVLQVEDREIEAGLKVRMYRPDAANSKQPALLFFHGGGGVLGNLDTHDAICRTLANAGELIVIAVDYRLGPEHRFPAAFEDAALAWGWVVASAAAIGADEARIAIGGDSAGGCLAAAVTQAAIEEGATAPAFQLLLCPSVDATRDAKRFASVAENSEGFFMTRDLIDWFLGNYLADTQDRGDPRLSPLLGEWHGKPPPALVATAGLDPLRDEGEAYAEALSVAGGEVTYRCYEHTIHDFFSFGRFLSFAVPALRECAAVMRDTLNRE
ncbi:MAG: alpha/beta hydrolase [Gammaproteobacteria bacterium]|nr:alpha/beta hydrolase [Gammaproteobacteria bacterium]